MLKPMKCEMWYQYHGWKFHKMKRRLCFCMYCSASERFWLGLGCIPMLLPPRAFGAAMGIIYYLN